MATWPATLPTFQEVLEDSYNEALADNTIRSEMDIGPAKVRRRGTAAPQLISGSMFCTSTQVGILDTFYSGTVNYGADAFDTIHPRTTVAVSVRFTGQPQIARMGDGWQVSISFEVLP